MATFSRKKLTRLQRRNVYTNSISTKGIRADAKIRLLTKIELIVLHLVNLCKKKMPKISNSWLRRPPKFMLFLAISVTFFRILTILFCTNTSKGASLNYVDKQGGRGSLPNVNACQRGVRGESLSSQR